MGESGISQPFNDEDFHPSGASNSGPIAQLSMRIVLLQSLFKSLDLINYHQVKRLHLQLAFAQMKAYCFKSQVAQLIEQRDIASAFNEDRQQETFLLTGGTHQRQTSKVLDLNQQYRSDQIRQLLMQDEGQSQRSSLLKQTKHEKNKGSLQFEQASLLESGNLSQLEKTLNQYWQTIEEVKEGQIKHKLGQLKGIFEDELRKLQRHYEEIDKLRTYLNTKIETVEQMELENLESHLVLEHRLRHTDEHRRQLIKMSNQDCQTDLSYKQLSERERVIEIKENEQEIQRFKGRQDIDQKERQLLRRERDLEMKERMNEEKIIELTYKQRELNQKLKNAISWPLICLENEHKLGEKLKDLKLTPDYYKGLSLENDQGFAEFMGRDENKSLLKSLQGELHMRAEGLLKYEYMVLQERAKNTIIKEYMESELAAMEVEKSEVLKERENYRGLNELERQVHEDKKSLEAQRMEFQILMDQLKKSVAGAHDLTFYGTLKSNPESTQGLMSKIEPVNMSVFDSAFQRTSNLISNFMSPSKMIKMDGEEQPISQKIDKILQNFDKLQESYISGSKGEVMDKQMSNMEAVKKLLLREAYFLEEEKRWINDKRQQMILNPQMSKILIHENSSTSIMRGEEELEEERKRLKVMQQNIKIEKELQANLNHQLQEEIEKAQQECSRLVEEEKRMNELKLKMLMKFEKIKMIEEFYNKYNPDTPVCLEIEVTDDDMRQAALKIQYQSTKPKKSLQEQKDHKLSILSKTFSYLFHHQLSENPQQSLQYFLLQWKAQVLIKRQENDKAREILKSLDKESLLRLGLKPQYKNEFTCEPELDWFEAFWAIKSRELNISSIKTMTVDQLYLVAQKFQDDIEHFWKFKCAQVLKMVNLHLKRRARLLLAFAFQQYKYQTQRAKVAMIIQIKEQAFKKQPMSIFQMKSDCEESQQLSERMRYLEQEGEEYTLAGFGKSTQKENRQIMDTAESHPSQTYTGISDIIMQQNQQNLKRHAVVMYLLNKKDSQESSRWKYYTFNKWKSFLKDIEMYVIKSEMRRVLEEVEKLKLQEQMLRTSFRVQKNELESKVSELITMVLGSGASHNAVM